MVKRGHSNQQGNNARNTRGHVHKQARSIQARPGEGNPLRPENNRYASAVAKEGAAPHSGLQAARPAPPDHLLEDEIELRYHLPVQPRDEQKSLAAIDLDPLYAAVTEMRERIHEAEQSLENSRKAQQTLQREMDIAMQMAQKADEELAAAAKKAAYLKHEAKQVCAEGVDLQQQLSAEEQHWLQMLEEDQHLLTDTEQKLRIAKEELQHIEHAKEVAARMNERELWRLGSSKQGLWLQRRKVQGNALPMTRDKSGNWHVPKVVASPGATYAQNVLEQKQNEKQRDHDQQRQQRLNTLAESAQALAERQSSQLEEEFLEQLAAREVARHLAAAATAPDVSPISPPKQETAPPLTSSGSPPEQETVPPLAPPDPAPQLAFHPAPPIDEPHALHHQVTAEQAAIITPSLYVPPFDPLHLSDSSALSGPAIPEPHALHHGVVTEQEAPLYTTPPTYTPALVNEDLLQALQQEETPEQKAPAYEPPAPFLPPFSAGAAQPPTSQDDPQQIAPPADDSLQFLARRAALETTAGNPAPQEQVNSIFCNESPLQMVASAELPQVEQPTVVPEANEEDIQMLARQANLLAQQHLARTQATYTATGHSAITQRVAEETGGQDHLLKEQQIAERAIAAAMAAAKKAAQNAMAISEQIHQQEIRPDEGSRYYSAERLIADALSRAAVVEDRS